MVDVLPLQKCGEELSLDSLSAIPLLKLSCDWRGDPLTVEVGFQLFFDNRRLIFVFSCEGAPSYFQAQGPGVFAQGLWKMDVAELFIVEPETHRYQEFNLSPGGAWWSAVFSEYRKLESEVQVLEVQTLSRIEEARWFAAIEIPLSALKILFSPLRSRANVAAIIFGESRRHLSWSRLGGQQVDFHRTWDFARLDLV